MPGGLLGFEDMKRFQLIMVPEEAPLMWLEMLDRPNHGFLAVSSTAALPGYNPQFSQPDMEFLGVTGPSELMLINIVTLRNEEAFANLKGPIVINRRTLIARQCVPVNVLDYSLEHPVRALAAAA